MTHMRSLINHYLNILVMYPPPHTYAHVQYLQCVPVITSVFRCFPVLLRTAIFNDFGTTLHWIEPRGLNLVFLLAQNVSGPSYLLCSVLRILCTALCCSNLAAINCSNLAAHCLLQPCGLCVFHMQIRFLTLSCSLFAANSCSLFAANSCGLFAANSCGLFAANSC